MSRRDPAAAAAAVLRFQSAVDLNPTASGYVSLAWAIHKASPVVDGKPMRTPLDAAEKCLPLDQNSAACHTTLGFFLFYYAWDWKRSEHHLRRGLELNPSAADPSTNLAMLLAATGRLDEALKRIDSSAQAKPFQATIQTVRASILYFQKRYPEAISAAERALSLDRGQRAAWDWRSRAQLMMGKTQDSVRSMSEGIYPAHAAELTRTLKALGAGAALRELIRLTREGDSGVVQDFRRAAWHAALDEPDRALDELESMVNRHSLNAAWIAVDPIYEKLRPHPRFESLLVKLGLK
jgi:tetratricopeptide (TPR) repeat protein